MSRPQRQARPARTPKQPGLVKPEPVQVSNTVRASVSPKDDIQVVSTGNIRNRNRHRRPRLPATRDRNRNRGDHLSCWTASSKLDRPASTSARDPCTQLLRARSEVDVAVLGPGSVCCVSEIESGVHVDGAL